MALAAWHSAAKLRHCSIVASNVATNVQQGSHPVIRWHTFRHTYSSLLRANQTDIKVTQELLRHASSRVTLDTYTQAVTVQKRRAQSSVIRLLYELTADAG